ncbi:restriction endonuclease subunit S [Kordia sp. TARA_039_SRF]|nr:restriction endonuclease subunit S [Kordia sp. TARA_039_SRF]
MLKNWKTYKLGEITLWKSGGTPSKSKPEYWNGKIPWISAKTLKGRYVFDSNLKITKAALGKGGKIAPLGSLLFLVRGSGLYNDIPVAMVTKEVAFNQDIKCVMSKRTDMAKMFLLYWFKGSKQTFTNMLEATSIGAGKFNSDRLFNIEIQLPPLKEQKAIAEILSAIDDKIENNLAINNTLEEMAMALYKHWFVDFDFPITKESHPELVSGSQPVGYKTAGGKFIESELGMIPKGWEVKKIGDLIETLGGGTPKTSEKSYWENGNILWYSPTDLTRNNAMFSFDSSKKINSLGLSKSSAKLFPPYSLLMSSRATIGALTINTVQASTNQGFITMIPNDQISIYQLYSWVKDNMDLIISKANGSTFKEISKTNFRNLKIIVGKDVKPFLKESRNIFEKVENNLKENQTLTKLRDTLLPKLISGEVRLTAFEEEVLQ